MIVVMVTTGQNLADARARLGKLGLSAAEVVAPNNTRRILLAPLLDESEGAGILAALRAQGQVAVLRPTAGAQLGAWTRHTRPIVIGEGLAVCFAWSEHDRRGLPNMVEIDPAGGFGTAEHPATRLLLEELASRIAGRERILDVGCGNGVLGLCALRLGASEVVALDIDERALAATRHNAALNGFARRVSTTAAPLDEIEGTFDVVLANIGRAALVELAPRLVGTVSPGGWLAVSGFAPTQCSVVAASLRPLEVLEQRTCDEWSALVLACRAHVGGAVLGRYELGPEWCRVRLDTE